MVVRTKKVAGTVAYSGTTMLALIPILSATLVSAISISSECQSALTTVVASPEAACLDPTALIPLFIGGNNSIVPSVDNWLKGASQIALLVRKSIDPSLKRTLCTRSMFEFLPCRCHYQYHHRVCERSHLPRSDIQRF